jgi:hypothetical protein
LCSCLGFIIRGLIINPHFTLSVLSDALFYFLKRILLNFITYPFISVCATMGLPSCAVGTKYSAYVYVVGFLLTTVASWVLREYSHELFDYADCADSTGKEIKSCVGALSVYRVALGNALFFSVMFFLTFQVADDEDPRLEWVHNGMWPVK